MSLFKEEIASVAQGIDDGQVISIYDASYTNLVDEVNAQMAIIAAREEARRSSAHPLLLAASLTTDELDLMERTYPEFNTVSANIASPVHALWGAMRAAANEWLIVQGASRYGTHIAHFGGSQFHNLVRGRRNVHVEFDEADEVMVQQDYAGALELNRLFQDFAAVQSATGVPLPRQEYDDFLAGKAYTACMSPHSCSHRADVLCGDLTMSPVSPVQFAMAMRQHGAEIGVGFFPYHPTMLVQDSGEFPGMGVRFEKSNTHIEFLYPEGRVGMSSIPLASWGAWLASHCFSIGSGTGQEWYQLELMKNRESFMFFRMVKLDFPPHNARYTHALEMPETEEMTLVRSWRLKRGLRSDPNKRSDWVPNDFLVASRVEKRVREFAMQLKPDAFTRHAIKKQIRVVNNRWVLSGTTVTVMPPMTPGQIEDLATAIYARAFVDRYESSTLASAMMESLKSMAAFNSASVVDRIVYVACAVARHVVKCLFGRVDSALRTAADAVRDFLSDKKSFSEVGTIPAPSYVKFSSEVASFRSRWTKHGEAFLSNPNHGFVTPVVESSIGGDLMRVAQTIVRRGVRARSPAKDDELVNVIRVMTDFRETRVADASDDLELVDRMGSLTELDQPAEDRFILESSSVVADAQELVQEFRSAKDPDPVASLNSLYCELFPTVAQSKLEFDTFHLSLDPQDRVLMAQRLRMPTYFGLPPNPVKAYRSRLNALNVPKRASTNQELLTAIGARNLNAPAISAVQEEDVLIPQIWENFLEKFCVEDAKQKLARFCDDPVSSSEDQLRDWVHQSKAKPGTLEAIRRDLQEQSQSMLEKPVDEYLAMLKSDVKPTLSTKPVGELTAPQVIVYHEKPISAFYSSIFRVLVRRFSSILKHNIYCNLLKDLGDIAKWVTSIHPYGVKCKYLENDFSKFDKSQQRFVFKLEAYIFLQLGLNREMLNKWVEGHTDCSLRSVSTGLSLHLMYQRKSGDATTAFGNVILNMVSVAYAYKDVKPIWAIFMGDDSLVCTQKVAGCEQAADVLAEIFNLSAKFYVTDAPYFASTFFVVDDTNCRVDAFPDPVKRIEKLSMHVSADDPQWEERHKSYQDSLAAYKDTSRAAMLSRVVPQRYEVTEGLVRGAAYALGTVAEDFKAFRSLWEEIPETIQA